MYKCIFILLWFCVFCIGTTNKICDFELDSFFKTATLKCEESPTAYVIIKTLKHLETKIYQG